MSTITCRPVSASQGADFLDFFDHRAFGDNPRWAGCYCHFPHHDPQAKAWPLHRADENRAAMAQRIEAGAASGYLARAGGAVVGWCNAGPWADYPMLRDAPEPDGDRLAVVFCFVIDPRWRGRGVATALLDEACADLARRGLGAIQAAPLADGRDAADNHHGPLSMYLKAGFEVVGEAGDGRLRVRKTLTAAGARP